MGRTGKTAPKRKGGRKPILETESVASAITQLRGNTAAVARRFKVTRQSVAKFIADRPTLRQLCEDAREGMLDDAESSLYTAALAGEAWAVCFFLKTQGRGRGYIEKAELTPPPQTDRVNIVNDDG